MALSWRHIQTYFRELKFLYFDLDFIEICSQVYNKQYISIGANNGLATSHYLNQRWHSILTHISVIRPQWVNSSWSDTIFVVSSGCIKEIKGFVTYICVTREMRGFFYHDAYMRRQAKWVYPDVWSRVGRFVWSCCGMLCMQITTELQSP